MIRLVAIAGYVIVGLAGVLLVWVSRRQPNEIAPMSTLLNGVMQSRAVRITLIVFWWWIGWHFFVVGP
jgi:Family of unknown function (DUF6186)